MKKFNNFMMDDKLNIYYNNEKLYEEKQNGYVYCINKNNGKKYRKHRLIWEITNQQKIPKNYQINHKDGNKENNNPSNLELNTAKQNTLHWYREINTKNIIENFKGKEIFCYNIYTLEEKHYSKIMNASRDLNISDKMIHLVLSKRQKTTHGFIFSYDKIKNIEEYINKTINFQKINDYKKRKIIVTFPNGDIQIFTTVKEACDTLKIKRNNIIRYLNKTRKNKEGLKFEFLK